MVKYRSLFGLCALSALAGCASNGAVPQPMPPQQPFDGVCGIRQDYCLVGTPSRTGDTTPPYEWMCLGFDGGKNASCSVPTAHVEGGEVFAGQRELEKKAKDAGPMRGLLTIADFSLDHPDCHPPYCHAHVMKQYVTDMGIPEENVRLISAGGLTNPFFRENPAVFENTLVVNFPTNIALNPTFRVRAKISSFNPL